MSNHPFAGVPATVHGHFRLNFYAAVYRLIHAIRRLGAMGGTRLEAVFEIYPFLAGYFDEMRPYLPDDASWDDALHWWQDAITAWEQVHNLHLPLRALAEQAQVGFASRMAFMIVGLVEEDSRFGTLLAALQQPLEHRRACLELVGQVMLDETRRAGTDPLSVCQPLLSQALVEVLNGDAPRSEWVLRVPSVLWQVARGDGLVTPADAWYRYDPPDTLPHVHDLIFPEAMGAVAQCIGAGILQIDGDVTGRDMRFLGPLCTMLHALPVFTYALGPGETADVPQLPGYTGARGIILGLEGGLQESTCMSLVTLTLPAPRLELRRRHWDKAFAGQQVHDLATISERLHLPGGYIRQIAAMAMAHAAMDQKDVVDLGDVRRAARAFNRQHLDTLAERVEVEGSWSRLVVSEPVTLKLKELEQRCRHRERLLDYLGPGFGASSNRGVRALFTGASGTGKSLAAQILAAELGMDLYRVDLSAVVNKYVGETEKNLSRILARAEALDVILLLDEGDALLGNRTEVRSANDRYANLETNFLLQKLEGYHGIVVVTSNASDNIDSAFQRRMDVVVNFTLPQAQERWHIWQLHLSQEHAVESQYVDLVAAHCVLTGGQIRNAALHATLLALDDGSTVVRRWHLEQAIASEYRKAGAICPLHANDDVLSHHGGMQAFWNALSS